MSGSGESIRKCLVRKWTDFAGYGFNLHAEKGKAGQYVGKVDEGSPAFAAGLKEGDRIVEVNDVNIGNENHQQVVTRIKAGGDSVWLLVVDKDGDEYCKNNKVVVNNGLEQVKVIECPVTRSSDQTSTHEEESNASTAEVHEPDAEHDYETLSEIPPPAADETNMPSDDEELPPPPPELSESSPELSESPPELSELDDAVNSVGADSGRPQEEIPEPDYESDKEEVAEPPVVEAPPEIVETPAQAPPTPPPQLEPEEPPKPAEPVSKVEETTSKENGEAPKKMSAAEMRASLAQNRKQDPRGSKVSAKEKMKMFQNL